MMDDDANIEPATLAHRMVEQQLRDRGIGDPRVLAAMQAVPRHRFVPGAPIQEAYADKAMPTAEGQTISQPYMVARMTELLAVRPNDRVLEVGTGSGYQTAVLAHLGASVVSIEQSKYLSRQAEQTLADLGLGDRVVLVVGDGTLGWAAGGPYDRILVTAGAPHLPAAYRDQLAPGGRIVIPLGDREEQVLTLICRNGDEWITQRLFNCRFVPLVGEDGWQD